MPKMFQGRRPSPAMAVAFLALLVALSGTAVALPGSRTVTAGDIKTKAVGKRAITAGGVGKSEAGPRSVGRSELQDNTVQSNKVDDNSLTGAASADSATTANGVGPNGVSTNSIQNDAVTSAKFGAVTQREVTVVIADPDADGGTGNATASCLPGEQLLGGGAVWGGAFTDAEAQQLHLVHSRPDVTNWLARGYNNTGASRTLFVRALCLG
jgi:hypothetical protein